MPRATPKALAYFSHSYRAEDREVNAFFWELFSEAGFFFTVDPQSKLFSIPYLESMMMLSNCFVAVIPRRAGTPTGCSPYILFEYGLAVQAQKPALVFVEQGLSNAWFPRGAEQIMTFNRQRLSDHQREFSRAIQKLARKVRGERNPDVRLRQPCGLIVGSGPEAQQVYSPALVRSLSTELRQYGRHLEVVPLDFGASFQLSLKLDQYDFLIMEVRDTLQVPSLTGYLLGRALPTIRLCHLGAGESPEAVHLPPLVAGHRPETTDEAPVIYWRDPEHLLQQITPHVAKFNTDRIELHTRDAGLRYFSRAGRRKAKVFLSNASVTNPLAHKLITELRLESIDFFHYQVKDAIPTGERWLEELERQVEQADILVALITPEFLRSPWCGFELQVARQRASAGKLKILPYVLDAGAEALMSALGLSEFQARECMRSSEEEIIAEIIGDLDRELRTPAEAATAPRTPHAPNLSQPTTVRPELALAEEDRRKLVEVLAGRLTPEDGGARSAWVKFLLMHAALYGELAGEDYTGSAHAVALAVVERAEALGTLPDGRRAICCLVAALREQGRVTQTAVPFLTELERRLQDGASE